MSSIEKRNAFMKTLENDIDCVRLLSEDEMVCIQLKLCIILSNLCKPHLLIVSCLLRLVIQMKYNMKHIKLKFNIQLIHLKNNRRRQPITAMVSDPDVQDIDENHEPEAKQVRKQNLISPNVAAALERTGTSNRNASIILKALIRDKHLKNEHEASYAINYRTIRLTRQRRVKEMAEEVIIQWFNFTFHKVL